MALSWVYKVGWLAFTVKAQRVFSSSARHQA
ncbi:hypothetical protein M878_44155 [Streptomyces roseochromogenus subsp. oscitans DS 12.976]|uniref:Uncharacterized protein n=1 Tax=Streptomyces roseochromogenus subsp. oscitans DS 12.976 TaxID=1352936 RepID=V6JG78_STRRC|nr:hypothetical protein M878_44155 [Streptomyces roseochromogenus subsp. oscitans DS 12.976]